MDAVLGPLSAEGTPGSNDTHSGSHNSAADYVVAMTCFTIVLGAFIRTLYRQFPKVVDLYRCSSRIQ